MSVTWEITRRVARDQRRAPLVWGGSLGAMSGLVVAIYPSIEDSLRKVMEGYPEALKETFRVEDMDTAAAYLDTEMFSLIIPLALAVFGARAVGHALSGAEERRHLDVLLSAPVKRTQLVAGAMLATAWSMAAILAVTGLAALLASVAVGAGMSVGSIAAGVASVWPLALFAAALAALAAGRLHRAGPVTAVAAGTIVAMYVVDLAGKLADAVEWARVGSVFRYYGSALRDGFDPLAFAGVAGVSAVLAIVGAVLFDRRDIYA